MAETPKSDDIQEAMKKQIAELRREMNRINKTLAERAEEMAEEASGWVESASDSAARAARQLRQKAQSVSETVQENPGTISSALMLGGVVGFALGMLIGQSASSHHRRWY
ncbi:MAG: hypothetical protein ABS35_09330 [Kaistia sp. SCN 65-12]|nr:MAG: hypothetical protein ABS35_09330 [Kaistia sp. SCN 65-12]